MLIMCLNTEISCVFVVSVYGCVQGPSVSLWILRRDHLKHTNRSEELRGAFRFVSTEKQLSLETQTGRVFSDAFTAETKAKRHK